jgi:lactobin A/cerein 7B family class IIb bacteriocin
MNLETADTKDMDLNALNDSQLDDVNGGLLPLFLAGAAVGFFGSLAGIAIGNAFNRMRAH